jgi:hypothetical protein
MYLIFIFLFLPILTFGQNAYIATDSLKSVGVKLIDGGDLINSKLCQDDNRRYDVQLSDITNDFPYFIERSRD